MNILILGNGFIGSRLYGYLKSSSQIDRVVVLAKSDIDYTDPRLIYDYISNRMKNGRFDVVINASGYTGVPNVDACEKEKDLCWKLNTEVPVMLEQTCKDFSARFIHISSGCIYDGYDKTWTEDDVPNFGLFSDRSSWYSKTKHAAETVLNIDSTVVLRISMPFTKDNTPRNYINKILKYDKLINYPNSVTCIEDLNEFILKSIIDNIPPGIYNVVHDEPVMAKDVQLLLCEHGLYNEKWEFVDISKIDIVANRSNCMLSDRKIAGLDMKLSSAFESLDYSISLLSKQLQWKEPAASEK